MAELTKRGKSAVGSASPEQLVEAGNSYFPDADIFDSSDSLIFRMDVPGVRKGDVSVEIDENNIMTVRAKSSFQEPQGSEVVREFSPGDYYRAFAISEEFDKDRISGKLENGTLVISVPRKESAKPRRIQISA